LDLRGRKGRETREDCIIRSFITLTLHRILFPRRMSWVGHVTRMGEEGNAYNVLVRKPEKGTIRRPTRI